MNTVTNSRMRKCLASPGGSVFSSFDELEILSETEQDNLATYKTNHNSDFTKDNGLDHYDNDAFFRHVEECDICEYFDYTDISDDYIQFLWQDYKEDVTEWLSAMLRNKYKNEQVYLKRIDNDTFGEQIEREEQMTDGCELEDIWEYLANGYSYSISFYYKRGVVYVDVLYERSSSPCEYILGVPSVFAKEYEGEYVNDYFVELDSLYLRDYVFNIFSTPQSS